MRVKLIGVSDEARKSESVHRSKRDYCLLKSSQIYRGTKFTSHFQGVCRFCAENKLFHSTFSPHGETQMWFLADPMEAALKFTSAIGARIPFFTEMPA